MVLGYTSALDTQQSTSIRDVWVQTLQKNSKSEAQLQSEMLTSTTQLIEEIREEALENAKIAAQEEAKQEAAQNSAENSSTAATVVASSSTGTTTASAPVVDDIKAPEEVTKADLESPIDIKL